MLDAKIALSTSLPESTTIAQFFKSKGGRALLVQIKSNGKIHIGSVKSVEATGNKTNIQISGNANYAGRKFRLKIRTNGDTIEVYFNNSLKYTGTSRFVGTSNEDKQYHFRWGLYYNKIIPSDIKNEVSELERYKE